MSTDYDRRPPEELTRRQGEVLALLARGLTNAQIAAELGITPDGAKYHVSEILARLALDTREEAADYWRSRRGLATRLRRWARGASLPLAWRWGATGLVAVAVASGTIVASSLAGDGATPASEPEPGSPTAVSTPSPPSATASPPAALSAPSRALQERLGNVRAEELRVTDPIPFPDGLVLFYGLHCVNCDGGPSPLYRIYRRPDGSVLPELVYQSLVDRVPGHVYTYALDAGRGEIYVGLCTQGTCPDGIVGVSSEDARNRIFRSSDGGQTWEETPPLPRSSWFERVTPAGPLVVTVNEGGNGAGERCWLYPNGPDQPCDSIERTEPPDGTPVKTLPDGSRFVHLLVDAKPGADGVMALRNPAGEMVRAWLLGSTTPWLGWRNPIVWPPIVQIDGDPPDHSPMPAVVDFERGEVHPMPLARATLDPRQFPVFMAALTAERIARVNIPGDCLNIRAGASLTAAVLSCPGHEALLRSTGEVREADGLTWVAVKTPDGRDGWASALYLER